MVDLDRFKDYNDEHGHQAGDRLLKQLAAVWRDVLRPTDVLARYGGEEFVVLLPNCPLDEARDVIERLRVTIPGDETCSAGIATWDGQESPEALVSRADAALYRAKREGRNRTVAARRRRRDASDAAGGTRTHTPLTGTGLLSPACIPVPPPAGGRMFRRIAAKARGSRLRRCAAGRSPGW